MQNIPQKINRNRKGDLVNATLLMVKAPLLNDFPGFSVIHCPAFAWKKVINAYQQSTEESCSSEHVYRPTEVHNEYKNVPKKM